MAEMNVLTEDFGRMGLEKWKEVGVEKDGCPGQLAVANEGEPILLVDSDDYVRKEVVLQPKGQQEGLVVVETGKPVVFVGSNGQLKEEVEKLPSPNAETKHGNDSFMTILPKSGVRVRRCVYSHQESAKDVSTVPLGLVQLKEKLRKTKTELDKALAHTSEVLGQFESYLADFDFTEQLTLVSKVSALEKDLGACCHELELVKTKNQYFQGRDSHEQRFLDGRYLEYPEEDIGFRKHVNPDGSTEVSLSRVWKFPIKEYRSNGIWTQKADNAAIGYMRLFGQAYIARSGRNQHGQGFIDRQHWVTEALSLAELVGTSFPAYKNYETHVEPQLVAFYVTRMLEASGHNLAQFGDPDTYQENQRSSNPVPIIIHVSEEYICKTCKGFIQKVNVVMERYGFYFKAVAAGVY